MQKTYFQQIGVRKFGSESLANDPSFYRGDGTQVTKKIVGRVRKNTLYIYTYPSPFRKRVGARPNGDIADLD